MNMIIEVPVSTVETNRLLKPALETVEPNRVALAELFTTAAIPPPAISAKAQVIKRIKSITVATKIKVLAIVANGIATASKR